VDEANVKVSAPLVGRLYSGADVQAFEGDHCRKVKAAWLTGAQLLHTLRIVDYNILIYNFRSILGIQRPYLQMLFGKAGGQSYVSLELNPLFAAIARAIVAFAGLDDIVEILKVQCRASLQQLASANFGSKARDMVLFSCLPTGETN
jgi:hypothetical protein